MAKLGTDDLTDIPDVFVIAEAVRLLPRDDFTRDGTPKLGRLRERLPKGVSISRENACRVAIQVRDDVHTSLGANVRRALRRRAEAENAVGR